jgi:hypothetical protein
MPIGFALIVEIGYSVTVGEAVAVIVGMNIAVKLTAVTTSRLVSFLIQLSPLNKLMVTARH